MLATDAAKAAAHKYGAILDGSLVNRLREVRTQGQRLSNPAVWDGVHAREFRAAYWPPVLASIDQALAQLQLLRSTSQTVIDDIVRAGSHGGGVFNDARRAATGLWAVTAALRTIRSLVKGNLYEKWLQNTMGVAREVPEILRDPLHSPRAWVNSILRSRAADDAMERFKFGPGPEVEDLGAAGRLLARIGISESWIGRLAAARSLVTTAVFLPLTIVSGGIDAITGGGYSGWRGLTDRAMGLAGAVGAGALLIGVANPVGAGIAAGAVLAYGAWSAGNLIYDHREAIAHAAVAVWDHVKGFAGTLSVPAKLVPQFHLW